MSYPAPVKNFTRTSGTADTTPARVPDVPRTGRSCVKLTNTGANAIYVYLTSQSASAPTISGAAFDFVINPDEFLVFPAGDSVAVWIATLASTATFEMLEADGDPAAFAASSVSGSATISGTVALASEHVEDTAAGSGDTGVLVLAVRNDADTVLAGDGDYIPLMTDNEGRLHVTNDSEKIEDTPHVGGESIMGLGERRIDSAASSATTSGDWATKNQDADGLSWSHGRDEGRDAHGDAVTARPSTGGGEARTSFGTAVDNGDAVRAMYDKYGRQVICPWAPLDLWTDDFGTATNVTTNVEILPAAGAGFRWAVMGFIVTNTSAYQTEVMIKGDNVDRLPIPAPAASGAVPVHLAGPMLLAEDDILNFATLDAVTSVHVWAVAFKVPV